MPRTVLGEARERPRRICGIDPRRRRCPNTVSVVWNKVKLKRIDPPTEGRRRGAEVVENAKFSATLKASFGVALVSIRVSQIGQNQAFERKLAIRATSGGAVT